jgi:hypothetical protein
VARTLRLKQPMTADDRIRWAPRLQPRLLERLYASDAGGFVDDELCDEVGTILHARCETFHHVAENKVCCPRCGTVFEVERDGNTHCSAECGFETTFEDYWRSVQNHYAFPGRAGDAFDAFYRRYPDARTYRDKIVLIDQLIHSFHIDEKQGRAVKSVASKLLEGNKKDVVRFLDRLSGVDTDNKAAWRTTASQTIHRRVLDR